MDTTMDTTMDITKQPADPTEVKHVAAIDDDEINLTLIEKVLAGFQVTSFDNPRRALEAFKEGATPDLIICDITMPGLDGFGLHGELRKIPALRSVPFIFLTALTDRDNVRRGMGQGADDYLTKPFTPDELRAAVRIRLQRTERLRHDAEQELIITSLGGLGLSTVKRRLQWEAKKVVELMLLLLDVGGSTTFQRARAELWWRAPAENHMHVLISRLRKTLEGTGSVDVLRDSIALGYEGRYRWDAKTFEEIAQQALGGGHSEVEGALRFYSGPFLAEFDSPWAERRRTELESLSSTCSRPPWSVPPGGWSRSGRRPAWTRFWISSRRRGLYLPSDVRSHSGGRYSAGAGGAPLRGRS